MRSARGPFKPHEDRQHNACITNFMQFHELGGYYIRSADALVEASVHQQVLLDVHVYSACFLYRHGIELLLKDLLWRSNYVIYGRKEISRSHYLGKLWRQILENAEQLMGGEFPLSDDETNQVKQLLMEFEEHDPKSDAFRYPVSVNMERTHPTLSHVNVRALHDDVHTAVDSILTLSEPIGYFYSRKCEWEAER